MKKEMVGSVPGTVLGMLADLCHKLQHGVITPEQVGLFLKKENPFAADDITAELADWQQFYRKFFGIELDLSSVKIPERRPGFDRLLVIAEGMTASKAYYACVNEFSCWRYADDLDKVVIHNDRIPIQTYAIWVRDRVEADEELKNLSANRLSDLGMPGITLIEREIYELKYFDETGKHLDVNDWTLCAGSRDFDGFVPRAGWGGGRFEVHWYNPGNTYDFIRSRSVVS